MKYNKKINNRLKRIEGQIRGIMKMMDEEKECKDVVTQLMAVDASINRVIGHVVAENLVICIDEKKEGINAKATIEEAINLLIKGR